MSTEPSGTYQMVPETVEENGVRRQTGRMLYFDQAGNAVDPVTKTLLDAPPVVVETFTPTAQTSALDTPPVAESVADGEAPDVVEG